MNRTVGKLRAQLESAGQFESIDEAASAMQAGLKIGESRPDLVLLDVDMPEAGDIEALREPDCGICLVVMTGHPELVLPALELDSIDCLVKPVQRERIALCLRRVRRRIAERRIAELALEIAATAAAIHGSCRRCPADRQRAIPTR